MIIYNQSTSFKCLKALAVITGLDVKYLTELIEGNRAEGQALGEPFRRAHSDLVFTLEELQENIRDAYTQGGSR